MEAIKREAIQAICSSQNRAESFENEVPSLQLDKTGGRKTFDVHSLSAKAVFEEQTELQLRFNGISRKAITGLTKSGRYGQMRTLSIQAQI